MEVVKLYLLAVEKVVPLLEVLVGLSAVRVSLLE
jgi:hypothetical protein